MKVFFLDEDDQVHILVKVLKARYLNDDFSIVASLAKAQEKVWGTKYDVLVMDIMLRADDNIIPGSSSTGGLIAGLQFINKIKSDPSCINYNTPIVILTGTPRDVHPEINKASLMYNDRFITKPISPDDFHSKLNKAMKGN